MPSCHGPYLGEGGYAVAVLLVDATRRRSTCIPIFFPALGLGLGLLVVAVGLTGALDLGQALMLGLVAVAALGWGLSGFRRARSEGDAIVVHTLLSVHRAPAAGSVIELHQGGGYRSPHFDVRLRPATGEPQVLARIEALGASRAPHATRRIAEALALPVHEAGLAPFEAALAEAARQRRVSLRWLGGLVAVAMIASVGMMLLTERTMATLVIHCPGGQVREGSATMLDGLELTTDPGLHAFELRPPGEPPRTQEIELVAGRTTVLDCRAHPQPSRAGPRP